METIFCDDIINNILSFVSIQDRAKLVKNKTITIRDGIDINRKDLTKISVCCKRCSFDNIAIQFNLCTGCILSLDNMHKFRFITYEDANKLYRFSNRKLDLDVLSLMNTKIVTYSDVNIILYDRLDIEYYVKSQFANSKMRLTYFYNKYAKDVIKQVKKEQSKEELQSMLANKQNTLDGKSNRKYINFYKAYIMRKNNICIEEAVKQICKKSSLFKRYNTIRDKFISLESKLRNNGLQLRNDSVLFREYLMDKCSINEEKEQLLLDSAEEMNYLFNKTNYKEELSFNISFAKSAYGFLDKEDIIIISKDTKSEFFVNIVISENSVLDIPRKWKSIIEKNNITDYSDLSNLKQMYLNS